MVTKDKKYQTKIAVLRRKNTRLKKQNQKLEEDKIQLEVEKCELQLKLDKIDTSEFERSVLETKNKGLEDTIEFLEKELKKTRKENHDLKATLSKLNMLFQR